MLIHNIEYKYNEQEIDLSEWFAVLMPNRYVIVQTIIDCKASYTIYDKQKKKTVIPVINHRVYLRDENNNRLSYTMKEIVREVYDLEYCLDSIPDLPGEQWFFIGSEFDKRFKNYNGTYLVSDRGRVKSYAGYEAALMKAKPYTHGYYMATFRCDGKRPRIRLHRIVAYYFLLSQMPKGTDFSKCEVHHWRGKENNAACNLSICLTKKQHERYDRIRRGIIEYRAQHPVCWFLADLAA